MTGGVRDRERVLEVMGRSVSFVGQSLIQQCS